MRQALSVFVLLMLLAAPGSRGGLSDDEDAEDRGESGVELKAAINHVLGDGEGGGAADLGQEETALLQQMKDKLTALEKKKQEGGDSDAFSDSLEMLDELMHLGGELNRVNEAKKSARSKRLVQVASDEAAFADITGANHGQATFVHFRGANCEDCDALQGELDALADGLTEDEVEEGARVAEVDCGAASLAPACEAAKIKAFPTLKFFADGRRWRFTGAPQAAPMKKFILKKWADAQTSANKRRMEQKRAAEEAEETTGNKAEL